MSEARWERLAADLAAAGLDVRVDVRTGMEAVYGRVRSYTSRSARLVLADGRHVTIGDRWWRKNPDVWIGWAVELEDAEGIGLRSWPVSKKRSEVVAAVLEAVGAGAAVAR